MPFSQGHAKIGGRQKGTINKLSLSAVYRLAELGVDPLAELARIAKNARKQKNPDLETKIYSVMCEYVYPKRKVTEHSGFIDGGSHVSGSEPFDALRARVAGIIERERAAGVLPIAHAQRTGTD